jgi:hypothetical protein
MALANVNLKFGINLESFRSGLQKVEKSLDATGKKMQQIGQNMSMYITLPVAAIGAASLKAASDAEETFSKFDTVFRDIQGSAETAFQTLRTEYGLSSTAAKQMLGDTGDLLTGFGFSQQGALDLSMEVQKLAVDLASFTNYSGGAKGASEALTKALLGEREQLKSLGIAIMEEDVKRQVALNTKNGIVHATDREAKAYATLQLAVQQSGNAIGDYARTSGSFANQSRLLRERITDLSVELGSVFLPLATKIVSAVTGAVEWFSKLDSGVKTTIAVTTALVAALGPLLIGLGFLTSNIIPMLVGGFKFVSVAVAGISTPILATAAAIAAGAVLIYTNWDSIVKFFKGPQMTGLFNEITNAFKEFKSYITEFYNTVIQPFLIGAWEEVKSIWSAVGPVLVDTIAGAFNRVITVVKSFFQILSGVFKTLRGLLTLDWKLIWEGLKTIFSAVWNGIIDLFKSNVKQLSSLLARALDMIGLDSWSSSVKSFSDSIVIENKKTEQSFTDLTTSVTDTQKAIASIGQVSTGNILPAEGGGINRQEQSGISAAKSALDNSLKLPTQIRGISDRVREGTSGIYDTMASFNNDINGLIGGSISGAFMSLGSAIGEAMATGGNVFAAVGKSILSSLGGFLGQLGRMMIEYGTMALVKAKLDASIAVPGAGFVTGPMAIAAGVALLALSTAIGSFASGKGKGASSGGGALGGATSLPARAMGGSVQMGQPYLVGERGPELFTPSGFGSITNARSTAGMGMGGGTIHITGTLVGEGRQLKAVFDDYVRTTGRTT